MYKTRVDEVKYRTGLIKDYLDGIHPNLTQLKKIKDTMSNLNDEIIYNLKDDEKFTETIRQNIANLTKQFRALKEASARPVALLRKSSKHKAPRGSSRRGHSRDIISKIDSIGVQIKEINRAAKSSNSSRSKHKSKSSNSNKSTGKSKGGGKTRRKSPRRRPGRLEELLRRLTRRRRSRSPSSMGIQMRRYPSLPIAEEEARRFSRTSSAAASPVGLCPRSPRRSPSKYEPLFIGPPSRTSSARSW